jgi:hypothetical protein
MKRDAGEASMLIEAIWLPRDLTAFVEQRNCKMPSPSAFPGMQVALRRQLEIPDRFVRTIDAGRYREAFAHSSPPRRFDALLDLYASAICSLFGDERPGCILVALPEELAELRIYNPRLSERERRALERPRAKDTRQKDLFDLGDIEEATLARELQPHADTLLFRNFYRALKARCMAASNPAPIQVVRRHTYDDEVAQQSERPIRSRALRKCTSSTETKCAIASIEHMRRARLQDIGSRSVGACGSRCISAKPVTRSTAWVPVRASITRRLQEYRSRVHTSPK